MYFVKICYEAFYVVSFVLEANTFRINWYKLVKVTLDLQDNRHCHFLKTPFFNKNGPFQNESEPLLDQKGSLFKGSSDQSHFIFEINVGKSRIRHRQTLNLIASSSISFEPI